MMRKAVGGDSPLCRIGRYDTAENKLCPAKLFFLFLLLDKTCLDPEILRNTDRVTLIVR
jgi:hypothetical protein